MRVLTGTLVLLVMVIGGAIGAYSMYNNPDTDVVIEVDENIPDSGLLFIDIPSRAKGIVQGEYIMDTRFELCFAKFDTGVVQVDCNKLKLQ